MVQTAEPVSRAVVFLPSERDDVLAVRRMCFEEYLELDVEGKLVEWVDGEARISMHVTDHHQRVVLFLSSLLHTYCLTTGAGVVRTEPYAFRARPGGNAREPDILFVAERHRHRLGVQYLDGPPDIVVEVVSRDSVRRDREEKFREYAAGGVPEYWIIDPRPGLLRADFYALAEDRYEPLPSDDGIVRSQQLAGFWLRVERLWDPNADSLAALREILGRDPLA
jgi:Uma2 family endonuclease